LDVLSEIDDRVRRVPTDGALWEVRHPAAFVSQLAHSQWLVQRAFWAAVLPTATLRF